MVDAFSYLALSKVFTANMTGNTVLLAIAVAKGSGGDALRSGVALAGFCLGVVGAVAVVQMGRPWPRSVAHAMVLEAVALAAVLAIWASAGVAATRYVLIAAAGVAMGAQSAAVRASDVSGVNTTFMTGTLLNALARGVLRLRGVSESQAGPSLPAAAWAVYAAGALLGAVIDRAWGAVVVVPPLALVVVITLLGFAAPDEPADQA